MHAMLYSTVSLNEEQQQCLNQNNCLLFTDLDGTLLGHHDYEVGRVPVMLQSLTTLGWPVIFNTSKTWAEVQVLQSSLSYYNPCVVENGGGIFCPKNGHWVPILEETVFLSRDYINAQLDTLNSVYQFQRMRDWSVDDIVANTGLSKSIAHLANERLFSEPVLWQDTELHLTQFRTEVENVGLKLVRGGRFCHLMGGQDKSTAMMQLVTAYEKAVGIRPLVIALGDNHNDKKMLETADVACILTLPHKATLVLERQSNVVVPTRAAPYGWCDAIDHILSFQG